MTDTEALRQALALPPRDQDAHRDYALVENAARRWLALAEGDEKVVKKMTAAILDYDPGPFDEDPEQMARAVLAAITEEGE